MEIERAVEIDTLDVDECITSYKYACVTIFGRSVCDCVESGSPHGGADDVVMALRAYRLASQQLLSTINASPKTGLKILTTSL